MRKSWKSNNHKKQRGDTLVEVAIAMAVLGVILASTMMVVNRSLLGVKEFFRPGLLELDFADCGTWILLPPGISPETVRPAAPVLQKNHRPRYSFRRRAIIGTERMF